MRLDRSTIAAVSVASALSVVAPQVQRNVDGGTRDFKVLKDRGGVPLRDTVPAPAVVRKVNGVRAERVARIDGVFGGNGGAGRGGRSVFGEISLKKSGRSVGFDKNHGQVLAGEDVSETGLGLESTKHEAYSGALDALINDTKNGRLFSSDNRGVASLTSEGISFVASRLPEGVVLFSTRGEVAVLNGLLRERLDLREWGRRVESEEDERGSAIGKVSRETRGEALSQWAPQPKLKKENGTVVVEKAVIEPELEKITSSEAVSSAIAEEALKVAELLSLYPEATDPSHPKNKGDDGVEETLYWQNKVRTGAESGQSLRAVYPEAFVDRDDNEEI